MAEEAKKKPDATPAAHGEKPGDKKEAAAHAAGGKAGGLFTKLPVLLGGVMVLEAAVLLAGFKFLGGSKPQQASGASLTTEEDTAAPEHSAAPTGEEHGAAASEHGGSAPAPKIDKKKAIEVAIVEMQATNKQTGRTFIYNVKIVAVTKGEFKDRVEGTVKERDAMIRDRIRTIIAQSDPEKLGGGSEPGLETLRRQVKYQLDDIIGEGMIDEVLVPQCIPIRTDY